VYHALMKSSRREPQESDGLKSTWQYGRLAGTSLPSIRQAEDCYEEAFVEIREIILNAQGCISMRMTRPSTAGNN
jgi:hypothetical protein